MNIKNIFLYFPILLVYVLAEICPNNTYLAFKATTAYRYIRNIGIPAGEKIKELEALITRGKDSFRIIGGYRASKAQFPWQVGLIGEIRGSQQDVVCGGSLITVKKVLTAAHCSDDGDTKVWRYTAVLASNLLFSGGIRMQTTNIIPHPGWVPKTLENDLAIVVLPISLRYSDRVFPISLPTESLVNLSGSSIYVSGYGVDDMSVGKVTGSQTLNFVGAKVIEQDVCWYYYPSTLTEKNICTSGTGGIDPCNGDSGGPLAIIEENKATLVGVVSYGSRLGCDVGFPAVYTRVSAYLDFIHSHIQGDDEDNH